MLNSISRKVVAGYAAILIILIITTSTLFAKLATINQVTDEFVDTSLPSIQGVKQASLSLNRLLIAAYGLYGYTLDAQAYEAVMNTDISAIESTIPIVVAGYGAAREIDLTRLKQVLKAFKGIMMQSDVDWDAAREHLLLMQQQATAIEQILDSAEQTISKQANQKVLGISGDIDDMQFWQWFSIISIVVITFAAFVMAKRTIVQPVKSLSRQLDAIVEKLDLRQDVEVDSMDEVAGTAQSVNQLLAASRRVNSEIAKSVWVLQESIELLNHSTELSDQEIVNLSQTVQTLLASVEQVQASIANTAQRSQSGSATAATGAEQVETGSDSIKNTASIISELSQDIAQSSDMLNSLKMAGDKVSSVVSTIAEIAEQTNLLALNAAIEAARAGESGSGFAVVASEVRTLASRTHESTYEINDILEEIVNSIGSTVGSMDVNKQKANDAVEAAQTTVASLSEIKQTVLTLSDENHELAQISQASEADMDQMRNNIDGINQAVEQVTQTSRETKQASGTLGQLVSDLYQVLNQFKT